MTPSAEVPYRGCRLRADSPMSDTVAAGITDGLWSLPGAVRYDRDLASNTLYLDQLYGCLIDHLVG